MNTIKRIIVALDLSRYSKAVLEYAHEVMTNTGADLIVLNVINKRDIDSAERAFSKERPGEFSMTRYLQDDMGRRSRQINDLIKEVCPESERIKITFRTGIPVEEIIAAITEENADFMVIGHKGKSDRPGFRFGSTGEKVFKHSPVPVLSFRSPHKG
jgi:nucleotide-binding universal stress UspA family protein